MDKFVGIHYRYKKKEDYYKDMVLMILIILVKNKKYDYFFNYRLIQAKKLLFRNVRLVIQLHLRGHSIIHCLIMKVIKIRKKFLKLKGVIGILYCMILSDI